MTSRSTPRFTPRSDVSRILLALVLGGAFFFSHHAFGQQYNLRFFVEGKTATTVDIKVQINGTAVFGIGGASICFTYSSFSVNTPVLLSTHNFSGSVYSPMTLTTPFTGTVSLNIEYNGAAMAGTAVALAPLWTDVATVRFNHSGVGTATFLFNADTAPLNPTILYLDDYNSILSGASFSPLTVTTPVELTAFLARRTRNGVQLEWSTATETNNVGFFLERATSREGPWTDLAFVPGAGTVNTPRHYSYFDPIATPFSVLVYRLRQVDRDGTEQLSSICTVVERDAIAPVTPVIAYPNPARTTVTVQWEEILDPPHLTICDGAGRRILEVPVAAGAGCRMVQFSVSSLPPGRYVLMASNGLRTHTLPVTINP